VIGSSLLCQEFVDAKDNPLPQYFQPRPSFAIVSGAKNDFGCDPLFSSASNYGPNNPIQIKLVQQRQKAISAFDHVPISKIPSDAVTASGSGLDPDISQANAAIQVDRVAAARHISPAQVQALVRQNTTGRTIGILGQPVVNVLLLNRALDEKFPV
jgi:K+-transporting ATPase ATPase C chain